MEISIAQIIGGVGVAFTILLVSFGLINYFVKSWFSNVDKQFADVNSKMDTINIVLTDHMKTVYHKIDEINILCRDRGQQIGEITGRLNGKD